MNQAQETAVVLSLPKARPLQAKSETARDGFGCPGLLHLSTPSDSPAPRRGVVGKHGGDTPPSPLFMRSPGALRAGRLRVKPPRAQLPL